MSWCLANVWFLLSFVGVIYTCTYKKIYTQYANQCFDKFRNLVKWKNKWYVVYFGAIFFEVQARVFVQLIFSGTFINFCFMVFTQVMMKELASVLIHVCKIFNYTQAVFWNAVVNVPGKLLKKKLEHSCYSVTFKIPLP